MNHNKLLDNIQEKLDKYINDVGVHLDELDKSDPLALELYRTCMASCFHMKRVLNELRSNIQDKHDRMD